MTNQSPDVIVAGSIFRPPAVPQTPVAMPPQREPAPPAGPAAADARGTRLVALVLGSISVLLLASAIVNPTGSHAAHLTGLLCVVAFVFVYPLYRMGRWIAGRRVRLARRRWAVWNAAWGACALALPLLLLRAVA